MSTITSENFENLMNAVTSALDEDCFALLGLRMSPVKHSVGDELENSFVWIDGECTNEELDGVSTMGIKSESEKDVIAAIKNLGKTACNVFGIECHQYSDYHGCQIVLVQGDAAHAGEDFGESVISNGVVIATFEL